MSRAGIPEFVIDKLIRDHDWSDFDCGNPSLNLWLQKFAWTNQQADSARTYVALEDDRVVGYYALTTGSVHQHESPPLRRSREVTHLCSDRVTHAKNRPCPRARNETGSFIRAEGAQGLCIPPTNRSPGSPWHPGYAPALRQMVVLVGHFS